MEHIIKSAIGLGASDLHIKAGDVFRARIDGRLVPLTKQSLTPDQTRAIALRLIEREDIRRRIDEITDYDCSWGLAGLGRFRVNILRQRGSFMVVMRVIPVAIPTFEQLQLPPVLSRIASVERGMVLVTGVTGSGKTSTIAAMLGFMNQGMTRHVVALENPIEFLHRDVNCSITQREIGSDTESFRMGLRAALRQDPDVIVIGEMRDTETVDTAMKAAETGHLLVSTLHTPDAVSTVSRVIAMFPPDEQAIARIRLAESLQAVVSQRLLPRADGKGRIVACEVMMVTPLIRDLIMDETKTGGIRDLLAEGRDTYGSQSFDQHLMELVSAGAVSFEVAKAASSRPSDFDLHMRTLGGQRFSSGTTPRSMSSVNPPAGAGPSAVPQAPPKPVHAATTPPALEGFTTDINVGLFTE